MRRLFSIVPVLTLVACLTLQSFTPTANQVKQAEVNGVKLTYVETGKGIPVVFVHGALSDYRVWEPQREAVAQRYRFVSYTQRYFGTNAWPDDGKNFSAMTHAADLAEFVRALNAGPVHLVSWSYGGLVATLMSLEHLELVRSQVLSSRLSALITDLPEGKAAIAEVASVFSPAIAAAKSGDTTQATMLFMEAVFRLPPGGFDMELEVWRKIWLDSARSVPLHVAAPPPPAITCDQLEATKSPMLVMRGAKTYAMWSLISDHMVRCASGSRLMMTIPNINHDGPMRDPAAFNAALLDFLEKNIEWPNRSFQPARKRRRFAYRLRAAEFWR